MTNASAQPRKNLNAGWILVTGLVTLCALGTWFTAHNYQKHVFSSARGMVLSNGRPESRVAADFSNDEAERIAPGQIAKITMTGAKVAMQGVVVSIAPATSAGAKPNFSRVIIRLTGASTDGGGVINALGIPGAACAVSIDSTIPGLSPESAAYSSSEPSPAPR